MRRESCIDSEYVEHGVALICTLQKETPASMERRFCVYRCHHVSPISLLEFYKVTCNLISYHLGPNKGGMALLASFTQVSGLTFGWPSIFV